MIDPWMIVVFLLYVIAGTSFFTLLGMLTVFWWIKKPDSPADQSNVIARIRAWWFGLTRVGWIASIYKAFQKDEMEVVDIVQRFSECHWRPLNAQKTVYESECGHVSDIGQGGPGLAKMKYCCHCGKDMRVQNNG